MKKNTPVTKSPTGGQSNTMGRSSQGDAGQKGMKAASAVRKAKYRRLAIYPRPKVAYASKHPPRVDLGTKICVTCRYKQVKGKASHKGHHKTCPKSRKYEPLLTLQEVAEQNLANARIPVFPLASPGPYERYNPGGSHQIGGSAAAAPPAASRPSVSFETMPVPPPVRAYPVPQATVPGPSQPTRPSFRPESDFFKPVTQPKAALMTATSRTGFDAQTCIEVLAGEGKKVNSVPLGISKLTKHITQLLPRLIRKKDGSVAPAQKPEFKAEIYKNTFGKGICTFIVPEQDLGAAPDPELSLLSGTKIHLLRWDLFPGIELSCPCCKAELRHDKFDCSQTSNYIPIHSLSGRTDYALSPSFKCTSCRKTTAGADGRLLHSIPEVFRRRLDFEPRVALFHDEAKDQNNRRKKWLLDSTASRTMAASMVTHGNGNWFAEMLYRNQGYFYIDRLRNYLSHVEYYKGQHPEFQPKAFERPPDWFQQRLPPSGSEIRRLYTEYMKSDLTESGLSDKTRCAREIESVECYTSVTFDHTFNVLKNFLPGLDATACATLMADGGEIALAVLTKTTAASDVDEAMKKVAQRPNFKPRAIYTDTFPANDQFWKGIFGSSITTRLGLFHFIKRITNEMNDRCEHFYPALNELRECLYRVDPEAEAELHRTLLNGTMNGTQMTIREITELKQTSKYNRRYSVYLRKIIYGETEIQIKLDGWFTKWSRISASTPLFTRRIEAQLEEAKRKAGGLQDPAEVEMYLRREATSGSNHQLAKYWCLRGESNLEAFHGVLKLFANRGMSPDIADSLCLSGTARYNVCVRHRRDQNSKPESERDTTKFRETPRFLDHSLLAAVNRKSREAGIGEVFQNVRLLQPANGERFFSEYLKDE